MRRRPRAGPATLLLRQRLLSKCQSEQAQGRTVASACGPRDRSCGVQQFVRAGASNPVWMFGKYCKAAACRVVVARGGHAQQTIRREVTAASLAGLHGRGLVQAGLWAGEEAGVGLAEHRFLALAHVLRNVAGQQAGVARCLLLRAGLNASLECYGGASI